MRWSPNVTVAAVIEDNGRFLMVKEAIDGEIVFNQPAGHLEKNETLIDAIIREVREETARQFEPTALVGLYRMHIMDKDITYLRACFTGNIVGLYAGQALDDGIIDTAWMNRTELHEQHSSLRSPLVLQCIDDYLAGKFYDTDILKDIGHV